MPKPKFKNLTAKRRALLTQAMSGLALGHVHSPESGSAHPIAVIGGSSCRGPGDGPDDTDEQCWTFEMVSPRATGLSAAELEAFFQADLNLPLETTEHPSAQGVEGRDALEDVFANGHQLEGRFDNAVGVDAHPTQADYCLIARTMDGDIAGFVRFGISVDFDDEDSLGVDVGDMTLDEARTVHLSVDLDLIYVLKKYRGQSVSTAMLVAVTQVYASELICRAKQVRPFADKLEMLFVLKPSVSGEWASETGRYVALQLGDKMDMVAEAIQFGETMYEADDVDALMRFEIAPVKVDHV